MSWPIIHTCDTDPPVDPAFLAGADAVAGLMMWALTGRRYGDWQTIGEKFRIAACNSSGAWASTPYKSSDGEWHNASCGGGCCLLSLRHRPPRVVTEIRIGGAIVDPEAYTLEAGVVRLSGGCPICNDCGPASIEVDYVWGVPVPLAGQYGAGEVACELLKGLNGGVCSLSSRAVSIARQGVQIEMGDAASLLESGLTGLPLADAFIRSVNPNGLAGHGRVMSPDAMPGVSGRASSLPVVP